MKKAKGIKSIKTTFFFNILAMCAILAATSVAWFAMNKDVKATGMKMTVDVTPNLVISSKNGTYGVGTTSIYELTYANVDQISYEWQDTAKKLQPATHDWDVGTETGLKYNADSDKISNTTGLSGNKADNSDLVFAGVPIYTSGDYYYIDFVVYVASVAKEYTDLTCLYASIEELGTTLATETNNAYKATSIDLYSTVVGNDETISASSSNYKGTLNLANTTNKVDLFTGLGISAIPINTSNSIAILMRCYFDGALTYTDASSVTKAYINTEALATNHATVCFKISFSAE